MDAHRVQIFNRADDNAVVSSVANDLHFELFPTNQAFFNQEFASGREIKTAAANLEKLFKVISDTTARATERKTRPDDGWVTQRLLNRLRLLEAMRNAGAGATKADLGHRVFELKPIFSLVDGLWTGANQLHLVTLEDPMSMEVKGAIERGLTAHRRQDGIGAFPIDNPLDNLPGNRFDVGHIGRFRVSHDGRRVAIDQNDAKALGLQCLARLGTRIIKFTSLPDDDRASTYDENAAKILTLWHGQFPINAKNRSNKYATSCGPGLASGWP